MINNISGYSGPYWVGVDLDDCVHVENNCYVSKSQYDELEQLYKELLLELEEVKQELDGYRTEYYDSLGPIGGFNED